MNESAPVAADVGSTSSAVIWRTLAFVADRGVSIIRTLVLAWLLVPADFGVLAAAVGTVELMLAVTNFGLENAVIQLSDPKRDDYDTAWSMRLIRSAIVSVVVIVCAPIFADLWNQPDAVGVMRLLALRPILNAFRSIGTVEERRALNFRPDALVRASRGITDTVVAIGLAASFGVWAMVWGQLAGVVIAAVVSYIVAPHVPRLKWAPSAKALSSFGSWFLVGGIVGALGDFGLQAIVSNVLGSDDLGRFYLAFRFGLLIGLAASTIVGDISFSLFSIRRDDDDGTKRVFRGSTVAIVAVVAPIAMTLAAVAEPATESFLSDRWTGVGRALALMTFTSIIVAGAHAANPMFLGRGRPELVSAMRVMRTIVLLPLAWLLASRYGLLGAVWALLVGELITQVASWVVAHRMVPSLYRGLGRPIIALVVASAAGGAIAFVIARLTEPSLVMVIVAAFAGVVSALGFARLLDRVAGLGIVDAVVTMLPDRFRNRVGASAVSPPTS